MQHEISLAAQKANGDSTGSQATTSPRTSISTADFSRAVWQRYTEALEADEAARALSPSATKIAAEREKLRKIADDGQITEPLAALEATLDYMLLKEARSIDQFARETRLTALQREPGEGETHQVQHEVDIYLDRYGLSAKEGTAERAVLAKRMMRAEIEALQRTLERDRGNYGGKLADPIVTPPLQVEEVEPVSLSQIWSDYIKSRVQAGFLKDGGKRQEPVIRNLRSFLKHDDARRVTKKYLIGWRDHLSPGYSPNRVFGSRLGVFGV